MDKLEQLSKGEKLEAIEIVRLLMAEANSYGYRNIDDVVFKHGENILTMLEWLVKTDNMPTPY
jgi:hypothetical protein